MNGTVQSLEKQKLRTAGNLTNQPSIPHMHSQRVQLCQASKGVAGNAGDGVEGEISEPHQSRQR